MTRHGTAPVMMPGVLLLGLAAAALASSEPADWIAELGGKVIRDQAGNIVAADLRGTWIYDSQMLDLARLPKLERLDLSHTRISDEGMLWLKPAPAIADLNLFYAEQITDQGMSAIKNWKSLKRLNLRGTRISDGTLEIVSRLTQLEALDIANTQVTDNGLDYLMTLVNLKELSLGHRRDSDNEVELLRLLPTLTYLNLSGPTTGSERPDTTSRRAKGSGAMRPDLVRAIAELKDLRILKLGYSGVNAEGLRTLGALGRVERLGLEGCARVDDEAIAQLSSWKSLKYLDLQESRATEKGVAALRKARPELVILGPVAAVKTDASPKMGEGVR